MIKLAAFLGNPGKEYEKTRHNAGFLFADFLFPDALYQTKFHALYLESGGRKILRPQTFMNLSGTSLSEAMSFFKLKGEEIAVCSDDMELPCGTIKVQLGGSMKGHNGLRDIAKRIGTDRFYRIRIGIGRPKFGDVRLFVTSPFSAEERKKIDDVFRQARSLLDEVEKEKTYQSSL